MADPAPRPRRCAYCGAPSWDVRPRPPLGGDLCCGPCAGLITDAAKRAKNGTPPAPEPYPWDDWDVPF